MPADVRMFRGHGEQALAGDRDRRRRAGGGGSGYLVPAAPRAGTGPTGADGSRPSQAGRRPAASCREERRPDAEGPGLAVVAAGVGPMARRFRAARSVRGGRRQRRRRREPPQADRLHQSDGTDFGEAGHRAVRSDRHRDRFDRCEGCRAGGPRAAPAAGERVPQARVSRPQLRPGGGEGAAADHRCAGGREDAPAGPQGSELRLRGREAGSVGSGREAAAADGAAEHEAHPGQGPRDRVGARLQNRGALGCAGSIADAHFETGSPAATACEMRSAQNAWRIARAAPRSNFPSVAQPTPIQASSWNSSMIGAWMPSPRALARASLSRLVVRLIAPYATWLEKMPSLKTSRMNEYRNSRSRPTYLRAYSPPNGPRKTSPPMELSSGKTTSPVREMPRASTQNSCQPMGNIFWYPPERLRIEDQVQPRLRVGAVLREGIRRPEGWVGYGGNRLHLVQDAALDPRADRRVHLRDGEEEEIHSALEPGVHEALQAEVGALLIGQSRAGVDGGPEDARD